MTRQRSLLIVEDYDELRRAYQDLFIENGFQVTTAVDGRDALRKLRREPPPDVVVLDVALPHLGGREVLAEIRRQPQWSEIAVIVVSGLPSPVPEADVQLIKPPSFEDLVNAALRLSRMGEVQSRDTGS